MTGARPVVWAIVHDLDRTGVPIALTRMAVWPGAVDALDLHVIARDDGPLRAPLEEAGVRVVALEPAHGRSGAATVAAAGAYAGHPRPGNALLAASWRRKVRALPPPDVVLVHGAGAWSVAESLHATTAPRVVLHLHELAMGIGRSIEPARLPAAVAVDRVLAVSEPVARIARTMGVPPQRLAIVPGAVETFPASPRGGTDVVSVGEAGWRKGTDRAIAAAYELHRLDPHLRWHWIGRSPEPGWALAGDVPLPVEFHRPVDHPWSVVEAPAALVVTSREDPLPLVALEAGARGIPVVACRGSGGLDGLLADERGWLADPVDPRALAAAVQQAVGSAGNDRGGALRSWVADRFAVDVVGPSWLEALIGPP